MENKEYWICPECGSEVDMNKNGCWRCRFVTDDVSKYKYNWKAEFVSNLKIMSIVIASLIALIALSIFLIMCIDNYYVEKQAEQARIAMEQKALKEQQLREFEKREFERQREREEQHRQMINERFQSKQNDALQKISNLESRYNSLLTQYGRVIGTSGEVQVMQQLLSTLKEINRIAEKEGVYQKRINNIQGKIKSDLLQRYGRM